MALKVLEPYAVKVARTVLRGRKLPGGHISHNDSQQQDNNKYDMRKLIYIFTLGLVISSCSRQVYVYKTENFELPTEGKFYITDNDSLKCSNVYSPAWDLWFLDSISTEQKLREIDIKGSLSKNLDAKGFVPSDKLESSDFRVDFCDYWFCRKRQNLASLYIKVTDRKDSSKQALIVNKTFDVSAKFKMDKEIERTVEELITEKKRIYSINSNELDNFPKINDVPKFPSKQLGLSFGYSLGMLPHSDLSEKYEDYYDGINVLYAGLDLDFYKKQKSGFGLKTIYYFGGNDKQNIDELDGENNVIGNGQLKDNVSFFFIGPSLNFRIPFYSYNLLDVVKVSPGYLYYSNKATRFDEKVDYTGHTIAWIISAGLDVKLNSHLNIGIEPKFVFGGFKKMEINGVHTTLDKKEKLNRVEMAIILKIN